MRSLNHDMKSPTDEAIWHEDNYRPSTQAESDATLAAFRAEQAERDRRGMNTAFGEAA